MADDDGPVGDVTVDLYALVVYLHASSNRDLLEAITHGQLTLSQLLLLEALRGGHRRPTIGQAAKIMHVSLQGASRIVDALARRGMVTREPDENDYRSKRIVITERGEQAIGRLHAARLAQIQLFNEQLAGDEREQLRATLAMLLERDQIAAYRPRPLAA